MTYKINQSVIDLVTDLVKEGYEGDPTFTTSYPSGISKMMDGGTSIQLTGFCKETLYLTADAENGLISAFGRYELEQKQDADNTPLTVEDIVDIAWDMYKKYSSYDPNTYTMPWQFLTLFEKYGYLKKKTVTTEVWEEV